MATVTKCDICGELVYDNHMIVNYLWNRPIVYFKYNDEDNISYSYKDKQEATKDICPECWVKILDFAKRFKEDPHIQIVTEEEFRKL